LGVSAANFFQISRSLITQVSPKTINAKEKTDHTVENLVLFVMQVTGAVVMYLIVMLQFKSANNLVINGGMCNYVPNPDYQETPNDNLTERNLVAMK